MDFPTWDDVGVPKILINGVRQLRPCSLLDSLVQQLVWHTPKRLLATYHCDNCGYRHQPDRASEQLSSCPGCTSPQLRLMHSWRHSREKVPYYTRSAPGYHVDMEGFFEQMHTNYANYFEQDFESIWEWGYQRGKFWVEFLGGTKVFADTPRVAGYKSAILTPFLWDTVFDWKTESGALGDGFICHIINQWTSRTWKE